MAYVTPVTNRTAASYFNVADWTRIYGNCQVTSALSEIEMASPIAFSTIATPTTATIPAVSDFNTLLNNLEVMRLAVASEAIVGAQTEIKDDWLDGVGSPVFDYSHVNQWESTIDAIWDHWSGDTLEVCPTLTGDLTITTGNQEIYVDCIDMDTYNIDLQGTANLYII